MPAINPLKSPQGADLPRSSVEKSLKKAEELLASTYKDGFWSYKEGNSPCIEPTAFCSLAMRTDDKMRSSVIDFLTTNQNLDGGWSSSPGTGQSDWTTSLALLALRNLSIQSKTELKVQPSVDKAVTYLLDVRSEFYGFLAQALLYIWKGREGLMYTRGWPWSKGCFHWVEPTSYSLMALKIPTTLQRDEMVEVLKRADGFILEHACKDGGWNHGNDRTLGFDQPAYVVTSAEALVALQNHRGEEKITHALSSLKTSLGYGRSALSLAWVTIARHCYGDDTGETVRLLIERQEKDGSFGPNLMVTGLSMLALQSHLGDNIFKAR